MVSRANTFFSTLSFSACDGQIHLRQETGGWTGNFGNTVSKATLVYFYSDSTVINYVNDRSLSSRAVLTKLLRRFLSYGEK